MKQFINAVIILMSLWFVLFVQKAMSQNESTEMEKLFSFSKRIEHRSYMLKLSNNETNCYWVNDDTLFSCVAIWGGAKIALSDIDFTNKSIIKSQMLVENTTDYMYQLNFYPQKGKPTFRYLCLGRSFISESNKPDFDKVVTLDMASPQVAEQAFNYLQRLSKTENKKTFQIVPTTSNRLFDTQLLALINGLKDDLKSLKDKEVEDNEYMSKVQLEGSVKTNIVTNMLNNDYVLASFGEFKTMKEAQDVYDKISKKVSNAKLPFNIIKQQEVVSSIGRTTEWLPFGELEPGLKGFRIVFEILKLGKMDKSYNYIDYWLASLKIEK